MELEKYIGFVMLLFFLSMICERLADFLKHYLSEVNTGWGYALRKLFRMGDLITKGDKIQEEKRYYRILKINIWCGFATAWALHADLFSIIDKIDAPWTVIGWKKVTWFWENGWKWRWSMTYEWLVFLVGCLGTGFFISFGSKFWHDMLDILLQIKNLRRLMADPETFKVDNIKAFDQLQTTYESEMVHAAYTTVKQKWAGIQEITATALRHDDNGYYIEVTLKKDTDAITGFFEYTLTNGQIKNIRVVKVITASEIVAHGINLSDTIGNEKNPDVKGTVGCLVRKKGGKDVFVLTCYHNVVESRSKFSFSVNDDNKILLTDGQTSIRAKTDFAIRDFEADAALIPVSKNDLANITNQIAGLGSITGIRDNLTKRELRKNIVVSVHGSRSLPHKGIQPGTQTGVLTGLYCKAKIKYSDGEHELVNLIAASNSGKAISGPGDSGACVIDNEQKLVGLIVAGSPEVSYLIPADALFEKLSLELF